jgi:hypothetical protein
MKPIAWYDPTNSAVSTDKDSPLFTPLGQVLPLYTQQEWVGLTDEEISELIRVTHNTGSFVRAIEAALKKKTTTSCGHEETIVKGSLVHCKKCDYCFGVD